MNLSKRQSQILSFLSENQQTTIKLLSEQLEVTAQTIKSELQALEGVLASYNITINIQSRNGIKVINPENLPSFLKSSEVLYEFSLQNQLLLMLVLYDDFLIMQDIADKLYVSKSLVEKQIPLLLKKYKDKIQSLRHYGYRFNGSEVDRRSIFVKLISPYLQGLNFKDGILNFNDLHFSLLNYFNEETMDKAMKAVDIIKENSIFSLTDESMKQFYIYLIFVLRSTKINRRQELSDDFPLAIKEYSGFNQYMELVTQIDTEAKLNIKEKERYYLCYLFFILRKQSVLNRDEITKFMGSFVMQVLEKIKVNLCLDLSEDGRLYEGLALHIYTIVLRKDNIDQLDGDNSWGDVKLQYPLGFEAATIAAEMINSRYKYYSTEIELIYLTLHFEAAIERMSMPDKKIKAIVVCQYGVASANLISAKIEKAYPEILVEHLYSVQEYFALKTTEYDFIITTEKLQPRDTPIINVSPALKNYEMKNVSDFIENKKAKTMLSEIIEDITVINLESAKSKEDIIRKIIEPMEKKELVTKDYLQSVLDREKISSTNFSSIAIPHGNPKYVKGVKLNVVKLEKPVKWEGSYVQYIFLFAFTEKLLKDKPQIFSYFYRGLAQREFELNLKKIISKSDEEFKLELIKLL
ncbi:MAG: PTS sugar transporter subunit IIA [Clostridium sp.]